MFRFVVTLLWQVFFFLTGFPSLDISLYPLCKKSPWQAGRVWVIFSFKSITLGGENKHNIHLLESEKTHRQVKAWHGCSGAETRLIDPQYHSYA